MAMSARSSTRTWSSASTRIRAWTSVLLFLVPPTIDAGDPDPGETPDALPAPPVTLGPGDALESEAFDLDPGGRLTYTASVRRTVGWAGLEVRPLDRETAGRLAAAPFLGVVVISVDRDGPASRAGLVRDDVILLFGEEGIRSAGQFVDAVERTPPGTRVVLGLLRDGFRGDIPIVLEGQGRTVERKEVFQLPTFDDLPRMGAVFAEGTPAAAPVLRRTSGVRRGLVVADVLPGGPSSLAGVARKDILTEAAGRPVGSAAEYLAALDGAAPGRPVPATIVRSGRTIRLEIAPAEDATLVRECGLPLGMVSWKRSAQENSTSVLWGAIFHAEKRYVTGGRPGEGPPVERKWGSLFDIVRYRSGEKGKELRLFWLLPVFKVSRTSG